MWWSAAQELGADEVVDYTQQSVDQLYKDNPFDAVLYQIGGATWFSSLHGHNKHSHAAAKLCSCTVSKHTWVRKY